MVNEIKDSESVVEVWIEEIEKMKKLKNSFAHLVAGSVESEIKAQNKDCSKDDCCCGKC